MLGTISLLRGQWDTETSYSEKAWMLHLWRCTRPGWIVSGGWNRVIFRVPSNWNHSMILWCGGFVLNIVLLAKSHSLNAKDQQEWQNHNRSPVNTVCFTACCYIYTDKSQPWAGTGELLWNWSSLGNRFPSTRNSCLHGTDISANISILL